uniref:Uncharacterized protein n=1 Tax=Setaria viridis TaxID=4556 RepID=A0A4U6VKG0_SETVI|nr:hypothetical protein SEVIR_3G298400v2 [Setaria viridis]
MWMGRKTCRIHIRHDHHLRQGMWSASADANEGGGQCPHPHWPWPPPQSMG